VMQGAPGMVVAGEVCPALPEGPRAGPAGRGWGRGPGGRGEGVAMEGGEGGQPGGRGSPLRCLALRSQHCIGSRYLQQLIKI
jgi:hypothetical protein